MLVFVASLGPPAAPDVSHGELADSSLHTSHASLVMPEADEEIAFLSREIEVLEPRQEVQRRIKSAGTESGVAGTPRHNGITLAADEEELGDLNSRWLMSYKRRDRETLDFILSDDFIGNYFGHARTKTEIIAFAMDPGRTVKEITWRDLQIRSNGAIAVVSGISTVRAQQGSAPETVSSSRYIDIYERRAGRWRAVAAHVSPVPNQQ
jgi:ketosteroid isomerase-like protein